MVKHLTGTKKSVIKHMALLAIRDQEALIDSLLQPYYGDISEADKETTLAIKAAEDSITDFRRFL